MTATTDSAILATLKAQALAALDAAQRMPADDDDRAMFDGSADDLLAWADDLEARLGFDVADFRAHLIDYCLLRNGDPEAAAGRAIAAN